MAAESELIEFSRVEAEKLRPSGVGEERWARARYDISFEDLVAELTGQNTYSLWILCPFHGETKPSFKLYRAGNDGYCFGCGGKKGYYNTIQFAAAWVFGDRTLSSRAIAWLERRFNLPRIPNDDAVLDAAYEKRHDFQLTFADLREAYLVVAAQIAKDRRDPVEQERLARLYFTAKLMDKAAQESNNAVELSRAANMLGRELGESRIRRILSRKRATA